MIIVDRDPRDLYALDQHIWSANKYRKSNIHFPTDITAFSKEWENTLVQNFNNPNALRVHFEDLVYDYENTVKRIEAFLGLSSDAQTHAKEHFNPDDSIENTQVYKVNPEWEKEAKQIEELIPELLYTFPYDRKPQRNKMFADDSLGKVRI